MASYVASNLSRDVVTLMLTKAEADALRDLALYAEPEIGEGLPMNSMSRKAAERAIGALSAATNTSARRAGFFD
jgi:hypothetical protein